MDENQKTAFWSKVDVTSSSIECWNWIGARKPKGYGNVRVNKKYKLAHRIAFELANGEIPKGMIICHLCDNPSCCNPYHLMLGTTKSNFIDMIIKGRDGFTKNKAIGARNCNAKLNDKTVINIRRLYKDKVLNQYQLADKYGVSQPSIGSIVRRETWRHI